METLFGGIAPYLFASPLAGQSLLYAFLLSRLEVVGVSLNFLDDIFLLDFAFETAQGVFQRLVILESYFRQSTHLLTCLDFRVSYSYNRGLIKKVKTNLCAAPRVFQNRESRGGEQSQHCRRVRRIVGFAQRTLCEAV
jgi:hypothetical protein